MLVPATARSSRLKIGVGVLWRSLGSESQQPKYQDFDFVTLPGASDMECGIPRDSLTHCPSAHCSTVTI